MKTKHVKSVKVLILKVENLQQKYKKENIFIINNKSIQITTSFISILFQ